MDCTVLLPAIETVALPKNAFSDTVNQVVLATHEGVQSLSITARKQWRTRMVI
jgi:hypothetical protein